MALLKDYTGCSDSEILDADDSDCSAKGSDFPQINNTNQSQINDMKETANEISMSDFIDRVYAARKIYIKTFNVDGWESIVQNRYKTEATKLKNVLGF